MPAPRDARETYLFATVCYCTENERPLPQGAPYQQQHCRVGGQPGGQPSHGEEAANAMDRRRGALPGAGQSCRSKWGTLGAASCRIGQDARRELVVRAPGCMIRPPTVWFTLYGSERKPRRRNGSRLCCTMLMWICCGRHYAGLKRVECSLKY